MRARCEEHDADWLVEAEWCDNGTPGNTQVFYRGRSIAPTLADVHDVVPDMARVVDSKIERIDH